jgi:hypothetical protein
MSQKSSAGTEARPGQIRISNFEMRNQEGHPPVPREHGAWAVLFGAFLSGVGTAGRVSVPVLLVFVVVTALALMDGPLTRLCRPRPEALPAPERRRLLRWLVGCGAFAALGGLPLLTVYQMAFLPPYGLLALGFLSIRLLAVRRQADRSLLGELLGTAGLALVGPVAHAVAVAEPQPAGGLLWLLLLLFFASGVFYVRMRIRSLAALRRGGGERIPARRACIVYHLLLLGIVPALAACGAASWWILLAFGPALWRAAAGLRRSAAPLNIRRLGWSEVALNALFTLTLSLTA